MPVEISRALGLTARQTEQLRGLLGLVSENAAGDIAARHATARARG